MYAPSPEDTALRPVARPPVRRAMEARRGVQQLITRYFFGSTAVLAAVATLVLAAMPAALPFDQRTALVASFGLLAVLALGAMRMRGAWIECAMLAVLCAATLALAATALLVGWGLAAPGLAFYGLFVCLLCAAASRGMGAVLAAVAALSLVGIELGMQWRGPQPAVGLPGDAFRLFVHLLLVGTGLAGGTLVSHVVHRYMQSADDREQRFRGLLAIAADAYWEIDEDYRLITAQSQRGEQPALGFGDGLGRVPWEVPRFGCDPDALDALLADLDTRAPFRDRPVLWRTSRGERTLHVSGEPRFDERGVFTGYWGVARDVTEEVAAARALAATESRYQELFARIPTPLVLHRDGRVVDANPAALALLGHDALADLLHHDLLAAYESGDSRERERRRIDELAFQPAGAAMPVADFRLMRRNGRRVSVRSASVRVEDSGGPATLSIYVDESERRAAEEAIRRSETMLSHLVATSPDLITVSDLAGGRFAMVNRAFERISGYAAAEVVGRTAEDLALWPDAADQQRFIEAMRGPGRVQDLATRLRTKEGALVPMLISAERFTLDRREYIVVNARDVSEAERSRAEREAILRNASIGIAVTRGQRFVLANPHLEQMFGWPEGSLAGEPLAVVWPDAQALADVAAACRGPLARGEKVEVERTAMRRDGSTFTCRLRAQAIGAPQLIARVTIWIVEDVTQQRQFEAALAAARDAAEAASRAKSAFLANTSHELRTPLNGLLNLAQLSRDPALDEAVRRQYLDQIVDSAQALAGVIGDILDLSKIQSGPFELEALPFDLGELLRTLQRAYTTLASARGLALELEIGEGIDAQVAGDPLRVRQILGNYLSNALKFTADGRVRLVARRLDAQRVRFEVHDSGPGIDAATRQRLFRPFTQADESSTRRFGGTGLGLAICRELAQRMGGDVGVDSVPGRGSRFWAELPLPLGDAPAGTAAPAGPSELRGLHVLMVEDNPVNMMIAVALLDRWGMVVDEAADGRQALEAVQRAFDGGQPYDAVLMDLQMPVMGGHEAARELRRTAAGRHLPIIALTAAALAGERERALASGMNDFVPKPIDAELLRATLQRWVRRA